MADLFEKFGLSLDNDAQPTEQAPTRKAPAKALDDVIQSYQQMGQGGQTGGRKPDLVERFGLDISKAPAPVKPVAPAAPPEGGPGLVSDVGNLLARGTATLGQGVAYMAGAEGLQKQLGEKSREIGERLSPAQRAASQKEFLTQKDETKPWYDLGNYEAGPAWSDPRSYLGAVVESLPATAVGMGIGGVGAKGLQMAGAGLVERAGQTAFQKALTGGATREAAVQAGRQAAEKAASRLTMGAGAAGFGAGEGVVSGGVAGAQMAEQIQALTPEQLNESPVYQKYLQSGLAPEAARDAVAKDAARETAWSSGGLVALLGAPMGIVFGRLFLSKPVTGPDGVTRVLPREGIGKTRLGSVGLGAAGEAAQEFGQSGGEAFLHNVAMQEYVDPSTPLGKGVLNQAVAGGIAGGIMGGAIGGAFHRGQPATGEDAPPPPTDTGPTRRLLGAQPGAVPGEPADNAPLPGIPQGPGNVGGGLIRNLRTHPLGHAKAPSKNNRLEPGKSVVLANDTAGNILTIVDVGRGQPKKAGAPGRVESVTVRDLTGNQQTLPPDAAKNLRIVDLGGLSDAREQARRKALEGEREKIVADVQAAPEAAPTAEQQQRLDQIEGELSAPADDEVLAAIAESATAREAADAARQTELESAEPTTAEPGRSIVDQAVDAALATEEGRTDAEEIRGDQGQVDQGGTVEERGQADRGTDVQQGAEAGPETGRAGLSQTPEVAANEPPTIEPSPPAAPGAGEPSGPGAPPVAPGAGAEGGRSATPGAPDNVLTHPEDAEDAGQPVRLNHPNEMVDYINNRFESAAPINEYEVYHANDRKGGFFIRKRDPQNVTDGTVNQITAQPYKYARSPETISVMLSQARRKLEYVKAEIRRRRPVDRPLYQSKLDRELHEVAIWEQRFNGLPEKEKANYAERQKKVRKTEIGSIVYHPIYGHLRITKKNEKSIRANSIRPENPGVEEPIEKRIPYEVIQIASDIEPAKSDILSQRGNGEQRQPEGQVRPTESGTGSREGGAISAGETGGETGAPAGGGSAAVAGGTAQETSAAAGPRDTGEGSGGAGAVGGATLPPITRHAPDKSLVPGVRKAYRDADAATTPDARRAVADALEKKSGNWNDKGRTQAAAAALAIRESVEKPTDVSTSETSASAAETTAPTEAVEPGGREPAADRGQRDQGEDAGGASEVTAKSDRRTHPEAREAIDALPEADRKAVVSAIRNAFESSGKSERRVNQKYLEDRGIAPALAEEISNWVAGKGLDPLTGFERLDARNATVDSAIAHVAETGDKGFYVETDIRNLGGLNKKLGNSGANEVFKAFTDAYAEAMRAVDGEVSLFRHGGDEISAVIVGPKVTRAAVDAAIQTAEREVAKIAKARGLDNIPHPKHPGETAFNGTGISAAAAEISPASTRSEIISQADTAVELKKVKRDVKRGETETPGPVAPAGQARGVGESAAGEDVGGGKETGSGAQTGGKEGITAAANEAATSPENDTPEPTPAQIEAGNYKKGHVNLHGLDISIENPKGSERSGVDPNGKPWSVVMPAHYGYVRRSEGADGDQVDVYIGPNPDSTQVFVVDQKDLQTGKFDEHKVVLGTNSQAEAEKVYKGGFSDGKGAQRMQAITPMSLDEFKAWLKEGDTKRAVAETKAPASETKPSVSEVAGGSDQATFQKNLERKGVATHDDVTYKIVQSDAGGYVIEKTANGIRVTIGSPRENWSLEMARDRAVEEAFADEKSVQKETAEESTTKEESAVSGEKGSESTPKVGDHVSWERYGKTVKGIVVTPPPGYESDSRIYDIFHVKADPGSSKVGVPNGMVLKLPRSSLTVLSRPADAKTERERIATLYAKRMQEKHSGRDPSFDGTPSAFHYDFADAILKKSAKTLDFIANGLNDTAKQVFTEVTGIRLPRTQSGTREKLKQWAEGTAKKDDKPNNRTQFQKDRQVNPAEDSLTAAIAKLGGLDRAEARKQGIDTPDLKKKGWRILPIFSTTGRSFDAMAEALSEYSYPVFNAQGNYDANTLLDALDKELRGTPVYAPAGIEAAAERDAAARDQAEAEAALADDPFGIDIAPGDLLEEGEYTDEMDAEGRRLLELADIANGLEEDAGAEIIERGALQDKPNSAIIDELEAFIHARENTGRDRAGETAREQGEGAPAETPALELSGQTDEEIRAEQERLRALEAARAEDVSPEKFSQFMQMLRDAVANNQVDTYEDFAVDYLSGSGINVKENPYFIDSNVDLERLNRDFKAAGYKTLREVWDEVVGTSNPAAKGPYTPNSQGEKGSEYTPRDGWRDNLIKAREYAIALGIREQVPDWTSVESVVEAIDRHRFGLGKINQNYDPKKSLVPNDAVTYIQSTTGWMGSGIVADNSKAVEEAGGEEVAGPIRSKFSIGRPTYGRYRSEDGNFSVTFEADGTWNATEYKGETRVSAGEGEFDTSKPTDSIIQVIQSLEKTGKTQGEKGSETAAAISSGTAPIADYGAKNTIFTQDAAAKARALLKAKLGQLNTGLDPEIVQAGITLAGYHIEAGARRFADYAKAMVADLGESVRPYLRSWYEGVRWYPGFDNAGMSETAEIEAHLQQLEANDVRPNLSESAPGEGAETISPPAGERPTGESSGQGKRRGDGATGKRSGRGETPPAAAGGLPETSADAESDTKSGGRGDRPRSDQQPERRASAEAARERLNYRIQDSDAIGQGGAKQKARQNLAAIRLLKQLQQEGRQATTNEQSVLVKYTGWGDSQIANGIFPDPKSGKFKDDWAELGQELRALLTDEEYAAARRTTQYAHYTSQAVIQSIYQALDRLGFMRGRIMEPGMGVGHFAGLMPAAMSAESTYTGIEFDPVSAGIARQLYPDFDMRHADFTQTVLPKEFFDLAIGNPPFSSTPVRTDKEYAKQRFALHDYFFAKSIDRVRPGGLLVFITSRYTMDKQGDKARRYLAERADLLGAIRLPQTAFKENAGTEVVTDVLFLQKRAPNQPAAGMDWLETRNIQTPDGPTQINQYYAAHPEMLLGEVRLAGTMYRQNEQTLVLAKDKRIEDEFAAAVARLPENVYSPRRLDPGLAQDQTDRVDFDPTVRKEGAFYLAADGTLMSRQQGVGYPVKIKVGGRGEGMYPKDAEIVKALIPVRDALKQVLQAQLAEGGDWQGAQRTLSAAYDRFVKQHGPINKTIISTRPHPSDKTQTITTTRYPNLRPFLADPDAHLVASIEHYDEETGKASKAAVFSERVIARDEAPRIQNSLDALNVTLNELGRVDIARIAELAGQGQETVIEELGETIFQNPDSTLWETADEYLSGNVRDKLRVAESAAQTDPAYERNVEALKAVQPKDLPPSKIEARLGAPWLPPEDVQVFARDVLGIQDARVTFNEQGFIWAVRSAQDASADPGEYGTPDRSAARLLELALTQRAPKVMKSVTDAEGNSKLVLDAEATEAANERRQKIKQTFEGWVWKDADRATRLAQIYNDRYNNLVARHFNGEHLTLPGMSRAYTLRPHQKRAVWRIIQTGNTYMAHSVGAGKTLASVAAAMEMRRLGLVKKPMFVVPNHMLQQFSRELLAAYPGAQILVADEQQFHTSRRQAFMGKVATGNWDAVIITHSSFGFIPVSPEFEERLVRQEIGNFREAINELDEQEDRITIKRLEKMIENMESKLLSLNQKRRDQSVTFEEMGIDFLLVDEAQEFRKLTFATTQQMKGIDPNGSQRAWDLYIKTRYLEQIRQGRNLVLMSGTPLTNTLGEMYTIQRYLQASVLEQGDIEHFDAWSSMFGETATSLEQTPSGNYQPVTRFARFNNLPALSAMFRDVADVVTSQDLPPELVRRPAIKGGKRRLVTSDRSEAMKAYQRHLNERLDAIRKRSGPPKKGDDIVPVVIMDGRKAAIDMRLVNSRAPNDPGSKLNQMIDNVFRIWEDTRENRYPTRGGAKALHPTPGATQMVFADLGVPSMQASHGFSSYIWIRDELIRRGVPRDQIAFMQDYKKSEDKLKLFREMNTGKKRILIGSTASMGTGVNAQQRLIALHHLDAPYLPADVEQREGRIYRQGNLNPTIEILAYATRGTYDATMWQILETKQRFIDQMMRGEVTETSVEDLDQSNSADQFALAKAIASGDERLLRVAGLEADVARLGRLRAAHFDNQVRVRQGLRQSESNIRYWEGRIQNIQRNLEQAEDTALTKFRIEIEGTTFDKRKDAGQTLLQVAATYDKSNTTGEKRIGRLGGFDLIVSLPERYTQGSNKGLRRADTALGLDMAGGLVDIPVSFTSTDPVGLALRLEHIYQHLPKDLKSAHLSLDQSKADKQSFESQLGAEFNYEAEYQDKVTELEELREALQQSAKEEEAAAAATELPAPRLDVAGGRLPVAADEMGGVRYSRREGAQTETPAFKRWFGDSVVTEDGKPGGVPLVVYHGTGAALDIFNPEERFEDERIPENVRIPRHVAAFFTNDSDNASQYAITRASIRSFGTDLPKKGQVPNGAAVQPVYLSLQNPLIVDAEGKHWMSIPFEGKKRNRPSVNDLARIALKRGNDGLIVHNVDDTPPGYKKRTATTFVAFDPAQIKSATGNTGAFSIENPDIRYAQTPADSRAATDFAPHATVADLRAEIEGALGKRLARNLFDRDGSSFRIVDTLANVPGKHPADVAGVSVGNKVYLVRQNIPRGGGAGLVAHEIGVHYGLERMVGRDQFGQIMQHVEAMAGRNVPAVRAARLRAASALLDAERVGEGRYLLNGETLDSDALIARAAEEPLLNEETLAYLAETEAGRKMPVVRRLLAAIRRFLRKLGMLKVEDMTVDDLVAMVKASVRAASRGERTVGKGAVLKYHRAWHGSPHDHDRFDMGKVGSGEGAQVYGHGLYFASKREVSEWYKDRFTKTKLSAAGKDEVNKRMQEIAETEAMEDFNKQDWDDLADEIMDEVILEAREGKNKEWLAAGRLYEVELAPDIGDYLDWDKPLYAQSEKVKRLLLNESNRIAGREGDRVIDASGWYEADGRSIYQDIARWANRSNAGNAQELASNWLHSIGIPGIKYLDQNSRGQGAGTYNFVIFDDSLVSIQAKYAKPAAQAQTLTAAFKSWFGNSMVTEDGKPGGVPLVVYHGTREDAQITEFDTNRQGPLTGNDIPGSYFTDQLFYARSAGHMQSSRLPTIGQYYLSIQNPASAEAESEAAYLADNQNDRPKRGETHRGDDGKLYLVRKRPGIEIRARLESQGYDGVIRNIAGATEYIAFHPTQIKSATGNTGAFDPANPDIRYSRAANPSADPDEIRDILETDLDRELARIKPENWKAATQDFVSDLNAKARPSWLKFLTRQQIVDVGSDVLPQALDFERISRKMDAEATSHMEHYGEIGQRWAKYASSLTSPEKRRQSALLARIMHDATLAEVDPAKNRPSDPDKHEDYDRLRALWDKLPADLQTLYKDVRDSYARLRADFEQALIERIEASVADERHRRAMIDQLRRHFEQARVKGPYFPLARFGDFYVIAEKEGESKQFMLFETPRQQREHVQALRNLGYAVRHGKKISNLKSEFAASPGMIKDMSDLIDETVGSRKEAESLKDGLFQMYLQSLPELSVRKKFIHRKGTPGFSRDALRAFSFQTAHGAKQLSKLRYGYQLADLIADMRDAADNSANPEKAADIVRALDDSYQWAMNPNNATWATRATSFGFAWYLGITPAAALVNLTQTLIITYPVMAARYGAGKAGAMLGRASKDYLRSRASKSFRAALEREYSGGMGRMLTELEESGAIDKTMTHSLLGMSEENFASIKLWEQKAMRFIGWGFHQAERMNREVTAIAAYRLMRDQNRSHAEAVQYAYDTIFESHFDYSSQNRAAFMRSNTARVLLLFRQYSQNTTYLLWRNFYKTFSNAPKEVRREARKKLLGVLGMTFLAAGGLGLPLMSVMFTVANAMAAAFGDPDDPFDAELEFRAWLADMIGQTPASVLARGPVNQLTGLDMATRTSLNELWMRSPDRELEAKGLAGYYLEQAAGPLAGVVMSVSRGVDLMQEGHVWRGIEASVPKVIKDSMRAMRYGEQGVQNLRGDPIMQEVDPWLLFWQAQGFSPAELSERYEQNNALKRLETRILNRRRRLINAYAMARLQRDGEMQREVMAKIRDFNRDQPRVRITGDTLNRSMQMRQRYSREMEKGLRVQPKLAQQLEQYRYLGS